MGYFLDAATREVPRIAEIAAYREQARLDVQAARSAACVHDGIDERAATFVAFSEDNPHVAALNEAMGRYLSLSRELEG